MPETSVSSFCSNKIFYFQKDFVMVLKCFLVALSFFRNIQNWETERICGFVKNLYKNKSQKIGEKLKIWKIVYSSWNFRVIMYLLRKCWKVAWRDQMFVKYFFTHHVYLKIQIRSLMRANFCRTFFFTYHANLKIQIRSVSKSKRLLAPLFEFWFHDKQILYAPTFAECHNKFTRYSSRGVWNYVRQPLRRLGLCSSFHLEPRNLAEIKYGFLMLTSPTIFNSVCLISYIRCSVPVQGVCACIIFCERKILSRVREKWVASWKSNMELRYFFLIHLRYCLNI